jgi:hypothetical protein
MRLALVFACLFSVGVCQLRPVYARPPALVRGPLEAQPHRVLALQVARVATNEGALQRRAQAALVWQTTRESAKTTEKRAEWLAKHSPRVHGTRPCRGGNCVWTPHLDRSGALPPGLGMPLQQWKILVQPVWLDTLAYVEWLVRGERKRDDPCRIQPKTWGCEADREGALKRGLFPIGCANTLDDGFTLEKYCWRDGAWVCDVRFQPVVASMP